jgi:amino acid transporter
MPPPDDRRSAVLPAEPATQQRAIAALFLAVLSLVGLLSLNYLQRGIYLVAYALLAGLMAMWLAVTSLVRARRSRTTRPRGSVTATVIAGVGIILSAVLLVAFATLGKQLTAYGQCLSTASTSADQQVCQNQFIHAVNREIATLRAQSSR